MKNKKEIITKFTDESEVNPATGMIRNVRKGKGRFDLMSPIAEKRIVGVYERGCEKYGDRNWEKGSNFSRFLDSLLRHINEYRMAGGKQELMDEDHLAQAAFNLLGLLHLEYTHPELNDLPVYLKKELDND